MRAHTRELTSHPMLLARVCVCEVCHFRMSALCKKDFDRLDNFKVIGSTIEKRQMFHFQFEQHRQHTQTCTSLASPRTWKPTHIKCDEQLKI